jgi:hypothetical protein
MTNSDLLQWFSTFIIACILAYLAFRKAAPERTALEATTAAQYAQAAKLKGEENTKLEAEIKALEDRLNIIERKRYRVTVEFEIGDPPQVGSVKIEPILITDKPPETVRMKYSKKNGQ